MSDDEIKTLYALAKQALADKDYDSAIDSLKQILVLDENYRDASRLLAQAVKLKRRRWYNDMRVWGPVAGFLMIGLLAWLAFTVDWKILVPTPLANVTNTRSPIATLDLIPTSYTWKRIYMAQEFARNNINSIVVDPQDPDVIYLSTESAGVYKSIDGGQSWQPAHRGIDRVWVSRLIIDPRNPKTLYASGGDGVYKTIDGGLNWQSILQVNRYNAGTLVMDLDNPDHLYTVGNGLLYDSTDGGANWSEKQIPSCPGGDARMVVDPDNGNELWINYVISYVGPTEECPSGFYRSEDGGRTWVFIPTDGVIRRFFLPKYPEEAIFASMVGEGLVKSIDRGQSWKQLLDSECYAAFALDPANPQRMFCGAEEGSLMLSEDSGETWRSVLDTEGFFFAIAFSPSAIFAGGKNGTSFYISLDGGYTWSERSNGLGAIAFNLRIPPGSDGPWFVDGEGGFFRSTDEGKTWSVIDKHSYFLSGENGDTLYRIGETQNLLQSSDGGQTWESMTSPLLAGEIILGIEALCQQTNSVIALMPYGYYLSTDGGKTWQTDFAFAWSQMQFSTYTINLELYSDATCQQFYAFASGNQILFSRDGGTNWAVCASTETFLPSNMALDPYDNQRIIVATTGGGTFMSTDGCQSWEKRNIGLDSLFVNSVAIDPNNPNTLYVGTDGGAYVSFDFGQTWGQVNDGLLGATVIYSIAVDKDSNVYAATPYGIFKLEGK